MNLFAISGFSVGISCLILSAIAVLFGKTFLHRLLLFFNVACALWGFGLFIVGIAGTDARAIFGWQLAHLGGFFIGPLFYHLASAFSETKNKKLLALGYSQAIFLTVVNFGTKYLFNDSRYAYNLYFNKANALYLIGISFYIFFVSVAYYKLIQFSKTAEGHKRTQSLYIIYGFLFGFAGATTTFLPMFGVDILYPFGNFGIVLYSFILSYAILRHRLMDFHVVLRKSIVYSLSVSLLIGLFIVLVLIRQGMIVMNLFAFSGMLLGTTCLALVLIIAFYGKTRLHRVWLLFNVAVAIWGFGSFFIGIASNPSSALTSWKFATIGAIFLSVFFYHMSCIFCNVEEARRKLIIFAYVQAFFFLLLIPTNFFVTKVNFIFDSLYYLRSVGPFYPVFVLIWLSLVIMGHYELIKFYRKSSGIKRNQSLYFFIGIILGFSGGGSTFLPVFRFNIYPFGNFTIPIYCLISTYAILRYRLMDFHLVVKKSIVYSLSLSVLTGLFLVLVFIMTKYFAEFIGTTSFIVTIISALAIAVLFAPLKEKIQIFVDKIFYKSTYDFYGAVQKISYDFASIMELGRTHRLVVDTLFETLKPKAAYLISIGDKTSEIVYERSSQEKSNPGSVGKKSDQAVQRTALHRSSALITLSKGNCVIIREELPLFLAEDKARAIAAELSSYEGEVAVPIFIENEPAYILILGGKRSGDGYSELDIKLLTTVANQSAVAFKVEKMMDKLITAKKLESVGILAGGIAHDLNNIMMAVLGYISLVKDTFAPQDKVFQLLEQARKACLMAKNLSDKLITFSPGGTPWKQSASLLETIKGVADTTTSNCPDVKYEYCISDDLWKVEFDKDQMSQVFRNLILNAQEAMRQGGLIRFSAENVFLDAPNSTSLPGGKYVKVSIQDRGPGIPEKDLEKIFDPYFTTKVMGTEKGCGLGLTICHSIMRKHDGHIGVESKVGVGTTFHIYLPVH